MSDFSRLCMGCMNDKGEDAVCSRCGFDESAPQPVSVMPIRTLLDGRYLIGSVIDSNCEGVTYLSWDTEENKPVRVREYFPEAFCDRAADRTTVQILMGKEFEFNRHFGEFLDIARCLARCSDLPSLFPVTDIFEGNNTAYYVTEYVKTIPMREFLIRNGGSLTWDQIRPLLMPVLTTLSTLHEEGLIHRGISPETLIVGVDGRIRITGFCVADARTARKDATAMNAQLFPGFAAIEQYGFETKQGTWTDVYGICATLYKILVGSPPADATERVTNDKMIIPAKIAQEIPRNVLTAMADGLAILADDRTQTIDELKGVLIPSSAAMSDTKKDVDKPANSKRTAIIVGVAVSVLLVALLFWITIKLILPAINSGDTNTPSNAKPPVSSTVSLLDDPESEATTFAVPDLKGKMFAVAEQDSEVAPYFKLVVTEYEYNGNYPNGTILSQETKAGTMLKRGSTINVKISLGSSTIVIPATRGMPKEQAIVELVKLGVNYNNIVIKEKYDDTMGAELVVATIPEQGNSISIHSSVTVFINSIKNDPESSEASSNASSAESSSKPSSKPVSSAVSSTEVSSAEPSSTVTE